MKIQAFNNIYNFKKINTLNKIMIKRFCRDFERMIQIRKIQTFFLIRNYISFKQSIITLDSIDLTHENLCCSQSFQNNELKLHEKENSNPNKKKY